MTGKTEPLLRGNRRKRSLGVSGNLGTGVEQEGTRPGISKAQGKEPGMEQGISPYREQGEQGKYYYRQKKRTRRGKGKNESVPCFCSCQLCHGPFRRRKASAMARLETGR
jgi:hypothetical protein